MTCDCGNVISWLLRVPIKGSKLLFKKYKNIQLLLLILILMEGYSKCEANFVPLSPISFLERAAFVYAKSVSIIYNDVTYTWKETYDRCVKLASALSIIGVTPGKVVATFAPNTPAQYELQFGVPMAGAILCSLNTSLDPPTLATTLQQLEAKVIFVDHQYIHSVSEAIKILSHEKTALASPSVVLIDERNHTIVPSKTLDYEELLSSGKSDFNIIHPNDECDPISINFTSGSTGKPKGAVYSHRSAYLNSLSVIFRYDIKKMPVFLWTVDMFRCNGWCFPWAVAALGGTNVCLREVTAKVIFNSIMIHKVTHLCGPPTILDKIASSKADEQRVIPTRVDVIVAGPLPSLEIILKVEKFGFDIHHGYGMTEALGPMTDRSLTTSNPQENDKDIEIQKIRCREGTHNILTQDVDVKDPETMISVPSDGNTIGEIMFKGNIVMLGYFNNMEKTQKVFKGGWYMTGDLGVRNPNGDIEMKDRKLDSIITNGEIVSTIEIERVIRTHPFVKEVAVVGKPDNALGETPCAFVTLKGECTLTGCAIIEFCQEKSLPRNMIPRNVCFEVLPMNSTGKVLKFLLRQKAKTTGSILCGNGY
ncbi:putative AMP-dependent synthetase/ligase, AMP-binding, AMP-binding enzyme domain-containing protein [Helianthus annuus]|uniref:AMP-dependent synthetase/ligase, AMP-binding enzyme domain-containing protein n=2 Tax=Helianthus annuus TaxID=4232 RepID=A0A251S424_HELAN|nr:putative AMP-dependent synthetase/ligase, AMP-binding enzyme domain-containing protein [Helianthus annuus]KAJ0440200.1 putative AMP-dependent synthetase/ligase, AMP-binding, AMP-binding enzyme domain, ANL [Helianthus annuus]KAJ0445531.1 putative AMP-dependent synthetase/ligase, AMP-binding, AMP-binding enzyme domain-containing protein [Helianthus annuus]KAJ0462583.1 putative AMP-dependent synthetase/ligase, AMP-binding, AMP-binding enzyme domain, ANL [Helianthus annuus]KAJ0642981.1 putative 